MIVEFSVKNFRSIKELQTISFVASKLDSPEKYSNVDKNNIAEEGGMKLLKTIGIYGANASGKSNIIKAFEYFLKAIRNEASTESRLSSLCEPFLYQDDIASESFFQIVAIIDGKKYRYGFTVKKNPEANEKDSKEVITSEWLYGTKEKNAGEYFIRTGMNVKKEMLPNKDKIPPLPYQHTLFLTHVSAFDNGGVCFQIRSYLDGWTKSNVDGNGIEGFRGASVRMLESENREKDILFLLSTFGLKYDRVVIKKRDNKDSRYVPQEKVVLFKHFRNKEGSLVDRELNLAYNESAGTKKLFDLAGFLLMIFNLERSGLTILDELDSEFHPSLLIKLIGLFNNPEINKSNAQLLFTSHDTNLMSPEIMRRDQFYFTEKDENDATRLYSLADLKGIRNDADFARQYLAGFYGAVPMLEDYSNKISEPNDGTVEPKAK